MTVLMVPKDTTVYPSLGGQVCAWIEDNLVFGPGDLRGQPVVLDQEKRALVYRMYEVFPKGHPQAGRRRFNRVALSLRKGSAKALALDTPIPTVNGWTTMGEIQVGESVFDEQGHPCQVVAVSDVFIGHECYRVRFRDGSEIVADAGHLWMTEELRNRPYLGSVKTTSDIARTVSVRADGARNHRIPVAQPLHLPDRNLPIDPWIFGAWLGDGRSDDAEFTMHADDYSHFRDRVSNAGYFSADPKIDQRNRSTYAVRVSVSPVKSANHNGKPTLKGILRDLGVLDNKHVPICYLRASIGQRLNLLQGLMDTDGTTDIEHKGYCSFTSTSLDLAGNVYELASGLGMKPSLRINKTTLKGSKHPVKTAYRVSFQAYEDRPVFSMPRKRAMLRGRPVVTPMSTNRHIVSAEIVESVPTRCIAVNSLSHLYLAGRAMIPTHNTEFAAMIAAVELHPDGPVRCDGWDAKGNPVGVGVVDPYIPLVAFTEEQSDELAYGALRIILMYSRVADDFDIGIERIMRIGGDGKAVSLASSPDSRDGARTTFQLADETHRWNTPRLKAAHKTMMANLPKRYLANAWSLEVTTAPSPGEGSVAEETMDYARQVADGKIRDSRLFFFHRQASDEHDLTTTEGVRAAVIEASGPVAAWSDIDGICAQWEDPTTDKAYLERVWLNRLVRGSEKAFDFEVWKTLAMEFTPAPGDTITIGFDGARWRDSTGLVATHLRTGYQWMLGLWEKPQNVEEWEVPEDEVNLAVADAFATWNVWRMYCDPPYWETQVATWSGKYGEKRVIAWWTNRIKPMAYAIRSFDNAIKAQELHHDGGADYGRHIGNAVRKKLNLVDDDGKSLWIIYKERPDSPFKIDAAMAGILSWQARCDALAMGVSPQGIVDLSPTIMGPDWGM